MSLYHYYIIELDMPEVVGACTISGNPGFSTPLTCSDQSSYSTTIKTHKFTDTNLILDESDVFKCVEKVAETTPKLKAGNGVASRATCSITFIDFVGDPNPACPALIAMPSIENKGSFFGKLKERNILANKKVRVKYYRQEDGATTLVRTNHYIATDIKRSGAGSWGLTCKDVLYKADDEKSQFPKVVTGRLQTDITSGMTTINMDADIADWTPYANYTAVVGGDLLMITDATGTSTSVTLTVVRASSITLGSRIILNTPEDHSSGDEVFRGLKFIDADVYDILEKIFEDADISTSDYDGTGMASELDAWLPNLSGSIDAIFYEANDSTTVLNNICATLMLDMWTDTSTGKIKLKATSPWNLTKSILTENVEIVYNSINIDEPSDLYYSRAFLQYDKRKLTDGDDDVNFVRSSLAFNTDLEGEYFYDETKLSKLGKSIILSNRSTNIEAADLTTIRYAQRFSNRPQAFDFVVEEADLDFELGDVIEIVTKDNQDFYGNPKLGVRAQVTQITPMYKIGRNYKVTASTYNPYIGGDSSSNIYVNSVFDVSLYTLAGGPLVADEYTFIFGLNYYGQNTTNQAINVGSFPSGSILNLVFINGALATAKGGQGGEGSGLTPDAENGGDVVVGTSGVTVNIYLNGTTPEFGGVTYESNGYLYAPGGGGACGASENGPDAFVGGGGGRGYAGGEAGIGTSTVQTGATVVESTNGSILAVGLGAHIYGSFDDFAESPQAGDGGGFGESGTDGLSSLTGLPGTAGRGLVLNSSTINIYTDGETSRLINGTGDTPTAIS